MFPIPLGAASSFDPNVGAQDHKFGARESAAVGLKQIYSPMVDVSHEPRWGRISEAGGEDPYLNSVFAAARVKAAQGSDYSKADKVVTSVKHYAAYGQPEAGRDYNTTDMSERRLHDLYLPPFKAAIDAGADTAMCSFNSINGVPGLREPGARDRPAQEAVGLRRLHRERLHGGRRAARLPAEDAGHGPLRPRHGRRRSGRRGGGAQRRHRLGDGVREHPPRSASSCSRRARSRSRGSTTPCAASCASSSARGCSSNPYVDVAARPSRRSCRPDAVKAAREAAGRSMVLLKNDNATLPLKKDKKTAVIGPLGDDGHAMLGPWWGQGRDEDAVTVFQGIKAQNPNTTFTQACEMKHTEPPNNTPADECGSDAGFGAAEAAAAAADQVVLALGESREMSGEANSRSEIDLPGRQEELIRRVKAAANGKPVAVVLFNGRPLTLEGVVDDAPAILEAWFPGVQAGNAVADVVFGDVNPGGKLPVSFPRRVGQVPIYYNHEPTGRPCDVTQKYVSRHRDIKSCDPEYEFGYGLSYSKFEISNLRLSSKKRVAQRAASARPSTSRTSAGRRATRSCSSTSATPWRASRSRSAACAASSA